MLTTNILLSYSTPCYKIPRKEPFEYIDLEQAREKLETVPDACHVGYVLKRRTYQRALVLSYETAAAAVVEIMRVGHTFSVWQSKLYLCVVFRRHLSANMNYS